jgi:iodotyrosine deiodinase
MRWLNRILDRPPEERAFVVVPVGYASEGATVPDIDRKRLEEVLVLSGET